ncbi:MAG TPA: hypothetical protein VGJ26_16040 [Pirellulales bacterium]
MTTQKINESIVLAAIDGFESQKSRIDQQIAELRAMLPGSNRQADTPSSDGETGKRTFSPDALRRMREAQKRRWARVRGESAAPASSSAAAKAPAKKKRRLSPEGRKAIQEALRKRWAEKRAAAPGAKKAAAKKGSAAKAAKKTGAKRTAAPATPAATE